MSGCLPTLAGLDMPAPLLSAWEPQGDTRKLRVEHHSGPSMTVPIIFTLPSSSAKKFT